LLAYPAQAAYPQYARNCMHKSVRESREREREREEISVCVCVCVCDIFSLMLSKRELSIS